MAIVVVVAVLVLLLVLILGTSLAGPRRNAASSSSPIVQSSPSPSSSPPASPTPAATVTATSTPLPSGRPAGGIAALALGTLRGEYAFVLNGGATTTRGALAEVWAIPLAGGEPRLAIRYVNATTPSTNTGDNLLARQFSPDGRRLVIAAATPRAAGGERVGLFIVDLESGRVTPLGAEDAAEHERPAWSPDGRRIAYIKRPIIGDGSVGSGLDEGIWIIDADGRSAARKMPLAPAPRQSEFPARTFLYSWIPDGRIAWFWENLENTLVLTDVDTGTHTMARSGVGDARGLSFRTAAPRIAGSFSDRPGNCPGHFVAVFDGAPEQVVARETGGLQCPTRLHDVRWSPKRDELLYVRAVAPKGELHIVDLLGADRRIAGDTEPLLPEWSSDGSRIFYIARAQAQFVVPLRGGELRQVASDGSGDRLLFVPPGVASLSDLAVRTY